MSDLKSQQLEQIFDEFRRLPSEKRKGYLVEIDETFKNGGKQSRQVLEQLRDQHAEMLRREEELKSGK